MFKLKGNIEPTTLIEYEFEEWQPNSNVWKYCERGHYVWKIRIDKDGYLRFNCPTNATIKKFYDLVKADIVDYVPEKPKKAYAYMTKLELEKEIEMVKFKQKKKRLSPFS